MSAAPWSLRSAGPALAGGFNRFFHAPGDARVAALVRITFAVCWLANVAVLYPDLGRWFTAEGVLPAEISREITRPGAWSLFWLLPDTPQVVTTCFWIIVAHAVLLGVGVLPRLNAAATFVWAVSLHNRNMLLLDGEDTVFRLIAFYLIWIPSGQAWSVEAWLRHRWRGDRALNADSYEAPGWGLRLLQIQMAVILFANGMGKLEGQTWLSGTAMYYTARLEPFFGRFPVPTWPFDSPWAVALITWSVLAVELLAPLFIWFRETRWICLGSIVLFHLANEWTMHLFLFHWIMLVGWLAFLSTDDLNRVSRPWRRQQR